MPSQPPADKRRRTLIGSRAGLLLVGITALGLAIFFSALKLPRVSIAAKIKTNELQLTLLNDWNIYELNAAEVSVVNAEKILFDGEVLTEDGNRPELPPGGSLRLLPAVAGSTWSAAVLAEDLIVSLGIPARADVALSLEATKPTTLRISIQGGKAEGSIDAGGEFSFSCNACTLAAAEGGNGLRPAGRLRARNSSQEIRFFSTDRPLVITVRMAGNDTVSHLSIGQSLHITKFDAQRGGLPISAISGDGRIAYPNLQLKPVAIQAGDFLRLTPSKSLSVRRISLTDDIDIEIEGVVKALGSGPAGVIRSRIPTFLQYFYYSENFQLILGAVMSIAGALAGGLYRLGYLSKPG